MLKIEKQNRVKVIKERRVGKEKQSSIITCMKVNDKAITLIALMITIIVLLILAGVTLSLTLRRKRDI